MLFLILLHPLHLALPASIAPYLAQHTGLQPAGQSEQPSWSLCPHSLSNVGWCTTGWFYTRTMVTLASFDYSNLRFGEWQHMRCDQQWVCLCVGTSYKTPDSSFFFLHLIQIQSFFHSKAFSCCLCLHRRSGEQFIWFKHQNPFLLHWVELWNLKQSRGSCARLGWLIACIAGITWHPPPFLSAMI